MRQHHGISAIAHFQASNDGKVRDKGGDVASHSVKGPRIDSRPAWGKGQGRIGGKSAGQPPNPGNPGRQVPGTRL
ncbi:unnamed protein product [Pararhodospirillum photometricum DSM 122]|uniref:Uncharacterized protein n=1 Tax=Pararhodospirillum photometricum DSM 122 TaxID=1150469 RepID=H6SNS2_PARPM|nr:unnamed protein product [Pararhodospirillum photometricum DSM 122]